MFLKLLDKKYQRVLDVGCGKGYWSYVGARAGRFLECCGSDVFKNYQLAELKRVCRKTEYRPIKNNHLDYPAGQFDLVFSLDVIEHVEDDLGFVKEHLRVAKKGGQIIVGTPNYWRMTNIWLMLLGRLKYPRNMGPDSYGDCIHLREYRKKQLEDLVIKAGGSQVRVYPCWMGILCLSLGIEKFPKIFDNFCHFWFIKFTKT